MAADESKGAGGAGTPADRDVIVVTVPAGQAQAVLDFVASLQKDADDVRGHMISRGVGGLLPGLVMRAGWTTTKCTVTDNGHDSSCDTDLNP